MSLFPALYCVTDYAFVDDDYFEDLNEDSDGEQESRMGCHNSSRTLSTVLAVSVFTLMNVTIC